MRYYLIILTFLIGTGSMVAQSTDEQLASHYYRNGEYDKAAVYYEKLYQETPTAAYYEYYLQCLIAIEDFDEAEKLVKKQQKREPYNVVYGVDLGSIYEARGDAGKAEKQYEQVIKDLPPDRLQVINLANTYVKKGLTQYALETYQQGQKLMEGYSNFNFEIASLYGTMGQYDLMIEEFLNLLEINVGYIQSVQNALNRVMDFTEESDAVDALRVGLLKKIQKHPDATIYAEMLIWLFEQQGDFESALVQCKALDKRERGGGKRIRDLAWLCVSNENYELAVECYEYIIDMGPDAYYYTVAKSEILDALYKQVTIKHQYTEEDLISLQTQYLATLDELGESASTVPMMKNLAHLEAFYMHLTEEPMFRLLDCIDMPGLSKVLQAECKVELADILLMNGAIWDASLYYGQVEKDFKNDVIGFEAKFKYAKIFYYTGDFRWAQSQLDVLKSSTHKLIANDAMQLSILISDNYNLDTVGVAMELYSQAELLTYQNKFDDALAKLDTINMIYPWHTLNDEILMQKYRIAYGQGEYEESAVYLTEIVSKYGDDILADDALFYLAKLYDHVLDDDETAMGFYSDLVLNYTGSLYTVEASERYRFLRGDFSIEKGDAVELDLDADPQEVLSGDQKVYNDDQQLIMEGWFENGELKDGKLYEYDESGELIRISIFENFEFIGDEDIDIE